MTFDAALAAAFAARGLSRPVYVERVGSTQDLARQRWSDGGGELPVVVAGAQEAGRGRLGRAWSSPEADNLYLTFGVRPDAPMDRWPLVTLAAAVAVCEALGSGFAIKWPNDILGPDDRKVAGILAEVESAPHGRLLLVGVGVNVASAPALPTAAFVRGYPGGDGVDRAHLAARIVEATRAGAVEAWSSPQRLVAAWRARAHTLGRRVRVGGVEGLAVDLDPDGALVLAASDGSTLRVTAGDVEMIVDRRR